VNCRIPLHDRTGEVVAWTLVDESDWVAFSPYRWNLQSRGYAIGRMSTGGWGGKRTPGQRTAREKQVLLHRAIAQPAPGGQVDHINGDRLDNRRANLRVVTNSGNAQNQGSRGGSSQYRGVTWLKRERRWRAQAVLNGRLHHIGTFADEHAAGAAAAAWRAQHMPYSTKETAR
jgi:hypothetical protein